MPQQLPVVQLFERTITLVLPLSAYFEDLEVEKSGNAMRTSTNIHRKKKKKKKEQCCHVAHFLHFQCVGIVRGSVCVLDILHNNISLLGRLVNDLRNNKRQDQICIRPLIQQPNLLLLTSILVLSFS